MRSLCTVVLSLLLMASSAGAQEVFNKPKRSGYLFFAPGAISVNVKIWKDASNEIGGGFEGYLYKGLGLGIDLGAMHVADDYSTKHWTGVVCFYTTYDFQRSSAQKLSPFVVVGLTLVPQFMVGGGYHFGGGVKYWFSKRFGLRLEFRDHGRPGCLHTYHDVQGRIGLMIR
jgi:opacity protein-like surface antigen